MTVLLRCSTWFVLCVLCALCPRADARSDAGALKLWNAGQRLEAIDAASAALARKPGDKALRTTLAGWEIAVHRFAAALEHLAPLGHEVDALRGRASYSLGDYARALECLSASDPEQLLMRIDALEALERFDASDAALAQAKNVIGERDARVQSCDGRRLARLGQHAQAVVAFRAALELEPLEREALFGLGRALIASGERAQGLAVLERQRKLVPLLDARDFALQNIDLAPRNAPNHTALGDAERNLGRLDRAEEAYRTAAELAKPSELVANALRHARLLSEDRKDLGAALRLLDEVAAKTKDARVLVRAGDLLAAAARTDEALERYAKALALRPQDAAIQARIDAVRAGRTPEKDER